MKISFAIALLGLFVWGGCAHNEEFKTAPATRLIPPSVTQDSGGPTQAPRTPSETAEDAAGKPAPSDHHEIQPAGRTVTAAVADPENPAEAEPVAESEEAADDLDDDLADLEDEFAEAETRADIADPLAPLNRVMFHFNDKLYFWVLKPVAQGYKAVVPTPVRTGVKNFFHNLAFPVRFVNCVLQGKEAAAGREFSRFFVNSTIGVLGIWDVGASQLHYEPADEDFGQTFGAYGVGHGFYIVWPFFGSSSLRDTVGMVGDRFLTPTTYLSPTEASLAVGGVNIVNETSFRIGDYESLKKAAIDPYAALRSFYVQYRRGLVER